MMKLKKSDNVIVLAGRDKGKKGAITRILPATNMVVVEGVNIAKRHTKPSNKVPRGGILEITMPMASGKVALICPHCKKPTRIGYQLGKTKTRICKKCNQAVN